MWLLKNFIGNLSLKSGLYVSVLWNFVILMVFLVDEIGFLIAIIEICFGVIMLFSLVMCPNFPSYYMAWMINKLILAAIFGISFFFIMIFSPFHIILICFPIFATLFSLEIYFAMITYSIYYDMKHHLGIVVSPPTTSKGPTNVNVPEVIVSAGVSDIRSNPLFVLPVDRGVVPSCPSSSTYFYVAPVIRPETTACASVHQPFLPYQVQPPFNPEFQPHTSFS